MVKRVSTDPLCDATLILLSLCSGRAAANCFWGTAVASAATDCTIVVVVVAVASSIAFKDIRTLLQKHRVAIPY